MVSKCSKNKLLQYIYILKAFWTRNSMVILSRSPWPSNDLQIMISYKRAKIIEKVSKILKNRGISLKMNAESWNKLKLASILMRNHNLLSFVFNDSAFNLYLFICLGSFGPWIYARFMLIYGLSTHSRQYLCIVLKSSTRSFQAASNSLDRVGLKRPSQALHQPSK